MTEEDFQRISYYVKNKYGIDMTGKRAIVKGRLENHIKADGWNSFTDYMNAVEKDQSGVQEKMLVNLLTTNYTYFMREFQHFDYLKKVVLPWAREKEKRSKDLRIWCGAASTGEEPYTIAMVISDFFGMEKQQWDARILATDVSTKVLQHALTGVYHAEQLKDLPEHWKKCFFHPLSGGSQYQVKDELRQEVIFRKFNLMDNFPFKKKLHVVFLRNVMIYFDEETKRELVQKVYDNLVPGGYLFIGLTESLDRTSTLFESVQPSIFRKQGGSV